jgi:hypothetical protein
MIRHKRQKMLTPPFSPFVDADNDSTMHSASPSENEEDLFPSASTTADTVATKVTSVSASATTPPPAAPSTPARTNLAFKAGGSASSELSPPNSQGTPGGLTAAGGPYDTLNAHGKRPHSEVLNPDAVGGLPSAGVMNDGEKQGM